MRKKIGEFKAQAADGREFTIYEYQDIIDARNYGERHAPSEVMTELRTSEDMRVTSKDDGTYVIVPLHLTVRRIP
jgi:hypothetical protein